MGSRVVPEFTPRPFGSQLALQEGQRCMCGHLPGRHRWGDNACPNPKWRCGNGQPQWLTGSATYRRGEKP